MKKKTSEKTGDTNRKKEFQADSANDGHPITKAKQKEKEHFASLSKRKENPKDGNIGKNNAGGYE